MTTLPLGYNSWKREVAQEPQVLVRNRYFETNPTNQIEGSALLGRPGLKRWLQVGEGPIRGLYSCPGSFSDALFVVSGSSLFRVDRDNSVTFIGSGIFGTSMRANVTMAATARIGSTPAYLYLATGRELFLYLEDGYALGALTVSGTIANGDKIRIGNLYYQWTSGSVDAGTPDGTTGNPWLVALGATNADALANMALALAAEGVAGTTYSTNVGSNPLATYQGYTATELVIRATNAGLIGNGVTTTVVSGSGIAFGAATLTGGGDPSLTQVQVPDDLGVISVGFIAGYVIVVVTQGQGYNGRWFWIEPGETIIRPLNFATAERSPDPLYSVLVVGDQFWLLGQATTEVWYPNGGTGTDNVPFSRVQGQLFDRGTWEGTAVQLKENLFIVDSDGAVFNLNGGLNRISTPGVEERIRKSMQLQKTGVL